jgi:septal ring factor EnvC (AmiA/AmiB activator)
MIKLFIIALLTSGLTLPAIAQNPAETQALRAELRALQAEQQQTNTRIARIEAALNALENEKVASPVATANQSANQQTVAASPAAATASPLNLSADLRLRYESK